MITRMMSSHRVDSVEKNKVKNRKTPLVFPRLLFCPKHRGRILRTEPFHIKSRQFFTFLLLFSCWSSAVAEKEKVKS